MYWDVICPTRKQNQIKYPDKILLVSWLKYDHDKAVSNPLVSKQPRISRKYFFLNIFDCQVYETYLTKAHQKLVISAPRIPLTFVLDYLVEANTNHHQERSFNELGPHFLSFYPKRGCNGFLTTKKKDPTLSWEKLMLWGQSGGWAATESKV